MIRTVVVAVASLAATSMLAACGSDASSGADGSGADGSGGDGASDAGTSLTIVVTPDEGAETSTYELTCAPAGGDHPQPQQACDALAKAGAEVFDAVPSGQSCTQIYGGPQTATVTGTYEGEDVDATFSRENGCAIDRWEKLGTTFFNVPLL